jgi:O-antigen/teichoic acid export membrane protein
MQFTKALQHTIAWKALNTILTFFINLLLVRILGADGSGEFFYSITLLSFAVLLISWSMESGITYYGSNNLESIPTITLFIIPWLLVQAGATWLLLQFISINLDKQLSWLFIVSNLVISYFSALFYARKWILPVNIIVCIINMIVLAGLAFIYYTYGNGQEELLNLLKGPSIGKTVVSISNIGDKSNAESFNFAVLVFFGGLLLQAFFLMAVFFFAAKISFKKIPIQPMLIRNIFVYSSIAFISNIVFFLVTRIDYFFVQKYCSEIALSNYVQVSKMGQLLVLLPTVIAGVVFPYSSDSDENGYLLKLQTLCRIIGLLFIPATFVIVIGGFRIFPLLFGPGFNLMYPAMLIYLPGFYFLSIITLLAAYIAGKAMLTRNLAAACIALVAVIFGDLLLIPTWGINAAAGISTAAYFLCMVYLLWIFKRDIGCKPRDFFAIKMKDLYLLFSKLF